MSSGSVKKEVEDGLTIFEVTGAVTPEQIVSQAVEQMAEGQVSIALWDFSQASAAHLTSSAVEEIANRLTPHAAHIIGGRVALVGSHRVNVGLGKMFKAFAELAGLPIEYRIFNSKKRAVDWLNSPQ